MKIYFVRHGKTPGNELRQYIGGKTDQHLSKIGETELSQISDSKKYPHVSHVFVSPMIRCRETAQLLFPNALQTVIEDMREMDFGIFEEKSASDLKDSQAYQSWVASHCEDPVPQGEDKAAFTKRCTDAFLQIAKEGANTEESLVFVVHGGTIMAVFSQLAEPKKEYYKWYVENGHGFFCDYDGAVLHVIEEL